jgi:GNAT superfamily N-acetyltransferase
MTIQTSERAELLIERGSPGDDDAAEALWKSASARPCALGQPAVRLIARDARSHKFLGVADYFRTFPPEDAIGGVAVVPEERHRGVGSALLRELAKVALRNGKRNLAGFMMHDDSAARRLLHATGIPVRPYQAEGGLYCELDLLAR